MVKKKKVKKKKKYSNFVVVSLDKSIMRRVGVTMDRVLGILQTSIFRDMVGEMGRAIYVRNMNEIRMKREKIIAFVDVR
jgi:hypothetical protein